MRLRTQLAIQAHIEALPPRAWSRKDFQELLAEKRDEWKAPQYLTPGRLITFLLDNDFARRIDIKSKDYGIKSRYVTGDLSLLPFPVRSTSDPTSPMPRRFMFTAYCRKAPST